jgi:hypothetical protein
MGSLNSRQVFTILARLPARVWLQAALGLIGFVVLAVLGFAVIAGVVAITLLAILGFKTKVWLRGLFEGRARGGPPARGAHKVIDVSYEIVERRNDTPRSD